MNIKKIITSLIIFLIILGVTTYVIFSQNSLEDIMSALKLLKIEFIIAILTLVILYFTMQGIYMKLLLKTLDVKISLWKGIFYSIVEFFFSGITPSSTGGQPVQLYYMSKDNIPVEKSLIVLIINTILFKVFLVAFGFFALIECKNIVANNGMNYTYILFAFGIIIDILVIVACFLLIFNEKVIKNIIRKSYSLLSKITKREINIEEKTEKILKKYSNNAQYIKTHKKDIIIGTIITFMQRIILFSVIYFIYVGLNIGSMSYWQLLMIQIFIQITAEGIPLPGGTGVQEAVTSTVYSNIFGNLAIGSLVLTRTFSFYLPLLLCMIIIIVETKIKYSKKNYNTTNQKN